MTCRAVTPDSKAKDSLHAHRLGLEFPESLLDDSRPLDQEPGISFDKLLKHLLSGGVNPEMVSSPLPAAFEPSGQANGS